MNNREKIEILQKWIDESKRIVFFSGAGVSTDSGIPDFRSQDGLYNRRNRTDSGICRLFRPDRIYGIRCSEDSLRIAFWQNEQDSYDHS